MESNEFVSSSRPKKPTIYEVAKRYAACVYAMADVFGLDPLTMLTRHREVCTAVFMQAGRENVRIDEHVRIPPLNRLYAPHVLKENVA
jgi:hypothetical protein